jgi:hypothetical protein
MGPRSAKAAAANEAGSPQFKLTAELERELREAAAEIDRGDCVELTPEQLERCIREGEWPWPDESRD